MELCENLIESFDREGKLLEEERKRLPSFEDVEVRCLVSKVRFPLVLRFAVPFRMQKRYLVHRVCALEREKR